MVSVEGECTRAVRLGIVFWEIRVAVMGEFLFTKGASNGGQGDFRFQPLVVVAVARRERNVGSGILKEERRYHDGGKEEVCRGRSQAGGVGGQGGDKEYLGTGYIRTWDPGMRTWGGALIRPVTR